MISSFEYILTKSYCNWFLRRYLDNFYEYNFFTSKLALYPVSCWGCFLTRHSLNQVKSIGFNARIEVDGKLCNVEPWHKISWASTRCEYSNTKCICIIIMILYCIYMSGKYLFVWWARQYSYIRKKTNTCMWKLDVYLMTFL